MAAKDVKFSVDARDKMLRGVDILAKCALPLVPRVAPPSNAFSDPRRLHQLRDRCRAR
jgi:hypothetical protein